jgi:hypothetical protein
MFESLAGKYNNDHVTFICYYRSSKTRPSRVSNPGFKPIKPLAQ